MAAAQNWVVTHRSTGLVTTVYAETAADAAAVVGGWVKRPPGQFHVEPETPAQARQREASEHVPGADPRRANE